MKTASFVIDLTDRITDESTLWWEHPVELLMAQAELESALGGEATALIYLDSAAGRMAMYFAASCEAGSRRVARPARPIILPARERLKVWGLRAETGGIWRVRLQFRRVGRSAPPQSCCASPEPNLARLALFEGVRRGGAESG